MIPDRQREELKQSVWPTRYWQLVIKNGESIYGTTDGSFKRYEWTASTRNGNRSDAFVVYRAYALQRFIDVAAGRIVTRLFKLFDSD